MLLLDPSRQKPTGLPYKKQSLPRISRQMQIKSPEEMTRQEGDLADMTNKKFKKLWI